MKGSTLKVENINDTGRNIYEFALSLESENNGLVEWHHHGLIHGLK